MTRAPTQSDWDRVTFRARDTARLLADEVEHGDAANTSEAIRQAIRDAYGGGENA